MSADVKNTIADARSVSADTKNSIAEIQSINAEDTKAITEISKKEKHYYKIVCKDSSHKKLKRIFIEIRSKFILIKPEFLNQWYLKL